MPSLPQTPTRPQPTLSEVYCQINKRNRRRTSVLIDESPSSCSSFSPPLFSRSLGTNNGSSNLYQISLLGRLGDAILTIEALKNDIQRIKVDTEQLIDTKGGKCNCLCHVSKSATNASSHSSANVGSKSLVQF
jgi:hypothetical protein